MFSDAALVVFILRVLVPLLMFRFPFFGGVFSLVLDSVDGMLSRFLGGPIWYNYDFVDKLLDTYYLTIMFIVLTRYEQRVRVIGAFLFSYRLVGVVLLSVLNTSKVLVFFPNVFEPWFFTWVTIAKFFPSSTPTKRVLIIVLIAFFVFKVIHEYVLHVVGVCSQYHWCGAEIFFPVLQSVVL